VPRPATGAPARARAPDRRARGDPARARAPDRRARGGPARARAPDRRARGGPARARAPDRRARGGPARARAPDRRARGGPARGTGVAAWRVRSVCHSGAVAASGLVRRSPGLARLLAAETISPLGDAMATTALILHVLRATGSATAVGLLLFAQAIPPLAAPVAGAVADRLRPGRLLASGWLAQAALAGLLALLLPPLGPLLAVIFALAFIDTPLSAAVGRCIPAVVADDDLVAANALRTGVREFGTVAGPPLAGLLFAASGARLVLGLDALTFLVVIPLALRLPVPARAGAAGGEARPSFGRDVRAGLAFVRRTPAVLAVALGFWVVVLFTAPDDLILPFLATRTFRAGPVAVGVMLAAASAGLLAGLPLVRPVGPRLGLPLVRPVGRRLGLPLVRPVGLPLVRPVGRRLGLPLVRPVGLPLVRPVGWRLGLPLVRPVGRRLGRGAAGDGPWRERGSVVGGVGRQRGRSSSGRRPAPPKICETRPGSDARDRGRFRRHGLRQPAHRGGALAGRRRRRAGDPRAGDSPRGQPREHVPAAHDAAGHARPRPGQRLRRRGRGRRGRLPGRRPAGRRHLPARGLRGRRLRRSGRRARLRRPPPPRNPPPRTTT